MADRPFPKEGAFTSHLTKEKIVIYVAPQQAGILETMAAKEWLSSPSTRGRTFEPGCSEPISIRSVTKSLQRALKKPFNDTIKGNREHW